MERGDRLRRGKWSDLPSISKRLHDRFEWSLRYTCTLRASVESLPLNGWSANIASGWACLGEISRQHPLGIRIEVARIMRGPREIRYPCSCAVLRCNVTLLVSHLTDLSRPLETVESHACPEK